MADTVSDNFATKNYDFKITEYADNMLQAVKRAGYNPTLENVRMALLELQTFSDAIAVRTATQAKEKEDNFNKPLEEIDYLLNGNETTKRYVELKNKYNSWVRRDKDGAVLINGHALYREMATLRSIMLNYAIKLGYLLYKYQASYGGMDKYKQSMLQ